MATIVGLTFKEEVPAEDLYTCPVCGKEYKTKEGLDNHMETKHPDMAENADQGE